MLPMMKKPDATNEIKDMLASARSDTPEVRKVKRQVIKKVERAEKLLAECNALLKSIGIIRP